MNVVAAAGQEDAPQITLVSRDGTATAIVETARGSSFSYTGATESVRRFLSKEWPGVAITEN